MPFPTEERFKNLRQQIADAPEDIYAGHSIEDSVFHGVVKDVVHDSTYTYAYIRVCRYDPDTPLPQAGDLVFETLTETPLRNVTGTTRYDKVYCINLAPQLAFAYFQPGQRITYWCYSGTGGTNTELIRGTYVTLWVGPNQVVLKLTGNAAGSGVYNARVLTGALQLGPTADLAMPDSLVVPAADNALGINFNESGTTGSHNLTTPVFVLGTLVGCTTASPGVDTMPIYSIVVAAIPPGTGQYKVLMILDNLNPGTVGWDYPRFY